jgi:pimeloyl-ACP methyl ester carboxylesterase
MSHRISIVVVIGSLAFVNPFLVSVTAQGGDTPQTQSQDREVQKLSALTTALRARNARDYAITTPNGIDEGEYVEIGGIKQWITIRGEDRRNPVLLFLHGGPGDATNPWSYGVMRLWSKAFTLVQWDQRGAGRTLGVSGGPEGAGRRLHDTSVRDSRR